MKDNVKILILGLTNKSGLAVARNLSKFGCEVDAIAWTDLAAKYSKHIRKTYFLENPEHNCSAFVEELVLHLTRNKYDALIPIHDAALEMCRNNKDVISAQVKIAGLNEDNIYKYSIDKAAMLNIGEQFGLAVPKGEYIESYTDYQTKDFSAYSFPLVAKPTGSATLYNNKLLSFTVKICTTEQQLTDFIRENIHSTPILIQEFIEGYGIGYNFIAKDGIILNEYIHKRINEEKGVSTLRESISTEHYGLKERVTEMVKAMGWNGVGMVEFKVKKDGTPVLMEFNGRFFGSTELSVQSGINLPVLFLKLFVLEEEIEKNIVPKMKKVRFLHDEVLLYTSGLIKLKIKNFSKWFIDLFTSFFSGQHSVEDTVFKDPGFTFGLYFQDLKRWYSKVKFKLKLKKVTIKALDKEALSGKQNIVFFCFGNICRSPFAQLIAEKTSKSFSFDSIGMFSQEDRMSPGLAVEAAKKFDIDLSQHLSKSFFSIDSNQVDLFVIMDKKNYLLLTEQGIPDAKISFLAAEEIKDPYGKEQYEFESTYGRIKLEIEKIFK